MVTPTEAFKWRFLHSRGYSRIAKCMKMILEYRSTVCGVTLSFLLLYVLRQIKSLIIDNENSIERIFDKSLYLVKVAVICRFITLIMKESIKELAIPYGLRDIDPPVLKSSEYSVEVSNYELLDTINNQVVKAAKGNDHFLVGGRFFNEYYSFPENVFSRLKSSIQEFSSYTAMLGNEKFDSENIKELSQFTYLVDLSESIEVCSSVVEVDIDKAVRTYGFKSGLGFSVVNLNSFIQHFLVNAVSHRFLGKVVLLNKELKDSIRGIVSDVNSEQRGNGFYIKKLMTLYPFMWTRKFIQRKIFEKYVRYEIKRREIYPEYDSPRDSVQYMIENTDKFDMNNKNAICDSILLSISLAIKLVTSMIYTVLIDISIRDGVYRDLKEEQHKVVSEHGYSINLATLEKMPILDAVIKESVRLSTNYANTQRYTNKKVVLSNGVTIPKDQYVYFNTYTHNRFNDVFGSSLFEFDYHRQLGLDSGLVDEFHNNLMWIYGSNVHFAQEYSLALTKMVIVLLVRKYEILPGRSTANKNNRLMLHSITGNRFYAGKAIGSSVPHVSVHFKPRGNHFELFEDAF